jgi:hypothetical protein
MIGRILAIVLVLLASAAHADWFSSGGGGGSGALTKITAVTASNQATVDFTGLPTTYNTLLFYCTGLQPITATVALQLVVGQGAGPTWQSTSYEWHTDDRSTGATTITGAFNNTDTSIALTSALVDNAAGEDQAIQVWIHNVANSSTTKPMFWSGIFTSSGSLHFVSGHGDNYVNNNAITGIRFQYSSGNVSVGTCTEYGLTQ